MYHNIEIFLLEITIKGATVSTFGGTELGWYGTDYTEFFVFYTLPEFDFMYTTYFVHLS